MSKEVIRQLVDALKYAKDGLDEFWSEHNNIFKINSAIAAGEAALSEPEPTPEPFIWVLKYSDINGLQVDSLMLLLERCKHAHFIDARIRINGKYEFYEADWLKHLHVNNASIAGEAELAKPEPEPVAWRYTDARGHYRYRGYKAGFDKEYSILKPELLYLHPAPKPEKV